MGKYHKLVENTMFEILKFAKENQYSKEDFDQSPYKYAIKGGLLGVYPETFTGIFNGTEEEFKFWDINFNSGKYRGKYIWKNILSSKEASNICKEYEDTGKINRKKVSKKTKNAPYYEHIEPKNYTYKRLLELLNKGVKLDKNCVKKILSKSKLLILTYDEKDKLDAKGEYFNDNDVDTANEWEKEIGDSKYIKETLTSMKDKNGEFLRCDSNGNGLARIIHLYNNGITFNLGNNNDICPKLIYQYLVSDIYVNELTNYNK